MMKKTWQEHDLQSDGLQSINLAYTAQRKDVKKAYLLACLFPFGAHQFYLKQNKKAGIFLLLTVLLMALAGVAPFISALIGFAEVILLTKDIINMETSVAEFNKQLKLALSLQQNQAVPDNFKGRYTDDDSKEQNTQQKILSFAEQEALLREMARKKQNDKS